MYTQDGALVLKDGVVLTTTEVIEKLNYLQRITDKWNALDEEIGKYYDEPTYDAENDCDFDEDNGNLCDIGETAAIAFGYL